MPEGFSWARAPMVGGVEEDFPAVEEAPGREEDEL